VSVVAFFWSCFDEEKKRRENCECVCGSRELAKRGEKENGCMDRARVQRFRTLILGRGFYFILFYF